MPCLKSKVQELMDLPSLSLEELLKEFTDSYPEAHISVQFEEKNEFAEYRHLMTDKMLKDSSFCESLENIMNDTKNYHINLLSEFAKKKMINAMFEDKNLSPMDHFKIVSSSKAKK